MSWLLNILSILVFFINRYFFRTHKAVPFSWKFWFIDNLPELAMTIMLNLIFMLLIGTTEATKALENLPASVAWIYFFGKPGLSVALGLGLSWAAYSLFSRKIKDVRNGKI
jgi:hypothetical protein